MKITIDKVLHFVAGWAIVLTIGVWCSWLGLISGITAAIYKEAYNQICKKEVARWYDLISISAGAVGAYLWLLLSVWLT